MAALLLLVVVIASWSSIFPPKPIEPATADPAATPSGAATPGGQPAAADSARPSRAPVPPAGGEVAKETPNVDTGDDAEDAGRPVRRPSSRPSNDRRLRPIQGATGQPGRTAAPRARRRQAVSRRPASERNDGAVAVVPPAGAATAKPEPAPEDGGRPEPTPAPETPRDTTKVTVPPAGTDLVEVAEAEINRWIAEYTVAYRNLDQAQVRSMNRSSPFRAAQYKAASVTFSNVEIRAHEDGQTAVLKANVQYRYEFSRGDTPREPVQPIEWPMRKTPNGWVANPLTSPLLSDPGASALGGAPSFVDVDRDQQGPAGDEEQDHRQDRGAARAG